jgi:hypothetical protein
MAAAEKPDSEAGAAGTREAAGDLGLANRRVAYARMGMRNERLIRLRTVSRREMIGADRSGVVRARAIHTPQEPRR